jgi:hypothetical protein
MAFFKAPFHHQSFGDTGTDVPFPTGPALSDIFSFSKLQLLGFQQRKKWKLLFNYFSKKPAEMEKNVLLHFG